MYKFPLLLSILALGLSEARANPKACALDEPDSDSVSSLDTGFPLGYILSKEIGLGNDKSLDIEPTVHLELNWGRKVVNLTKANTKNSPKA